jgi:hypothetical protein
MEDQDDLFAELGVDRRAAQELEEQVLNEVRNMRKGGLPDAPVLCMGY